MAWRGLHLTQPARLSYADGQLVVNREDGEIKTAIEDIGWLVLDTPQVSLSLPVISACMEAGVAIITTDIRHHPSGLTLPFHRHYRQAAVAILQVEAGAPLKKRLWQRIVQAKIINQSAVLRTDGTGSAPLEEMARLVGSGDPENVEARAARAYWSALWPDFRRQDETDLRNAMLNYGYAILRAVIARALVAAGLLPCLGLHHASDQNPFNLADDLIEPFRPLADRVVVKLCQNGSEHVGRLELQHRRVLATLPLTEVKIGKETMTVLHAAEAAATSLVRALESSSAAVLKLPELMHS
jgi:CRISPR-associated protein Cas1